MDNPFEILSNKLSHIEHQLEMLTKSAYLNNQGLNSDVIGGIDLAVKVTGLAKPTIYSLSCKREIPCFKKNKKLYFSQNELLDWIKSGKCNTRLKIVEEVETRQIQACRKGRPKTKVS